MALSERDRRTVTIGGIVVGVLLAGFVLFSFLGGGEEGFPPIPPTTPGAGSPSPSPGGGGPPIQSFTGRDPFSVPPALSPSPSPRFSGGGGNGSGTPSPSNGGGSGSQTPSPTAPGNGSSQNVGGSTVVLLDVFQRDGATHVQVEVDGTVFDVVVGEQFAGGRFELRSVAEATAPRSSSATSHSPSASPRRNSPGDPPTGGAVAGRGGGARAAPALSEPRDGVRYDAAVLRMLTAGESHGKALVAVLEGMPAAVPVGSEGDRGRARPASPRARPRRATEAWRPTRSTS